MVWKDASDEPLDVIETNECAQVHTLTVARFRRAFNEIEKLRADRDQYDSWAREIKVNIDAMRRENDELRAALGVLANQADNNWTKEYARLALEQKVDKS